MKYIFLSIAILLPALAIGCAGPARPYITPAHPAVSQRGFRVIADRLDTELLSSLVIDYINLYRNKRNLPILTCEVEASHTAFWMANYQANRGVVSHKAMVLGMERFGDRYRRNGGGVYACGYENAGWYPTFAPPFGRNYTYDEMARNIVDGWINSPTHHECLVAKADGATGVIGLGVASGRHNGDTGIYTTMNVFFYLPHPRLMGYKDQEKVEQHALAPEQPAAVSSQHPEGTATAKKNVRKKK